MNAVRRLLAQSRLILTATVMLAAVGLVAWLTMPRQEDPTMTNRWGLVTVEFPGADAEKVESMVLDPIEEHLAQVESVHEISATARAGFASLVLVLRDDVDATEVDEAWRDVETALDAARQELPDGASEPYLDRDFADQTSVVWAISGPGDARLHRVADAMKDELLGGNQVARVELVADPGEQIVVELRDAAVHRFGLTVEALQRQLAARNASLPGGAIRVGDKLASLRPGAEFRSFAELRETPIALPSGAMVPLRELAEVRFGPRDPRIDRIRLDGVPAVGIAIVPREGINLVDFGAKMRALADTLRARYPDVTLDEVIFQPDRVEARISDLGRSLLLGIAIVAGILWVSMGARVGLVVSAVIPLVSFGALALYAAGGGVLHQMSIAALVIALGMLVDNAIVVAEHVQGSLDRGLSRLQAATLAVRELALPLGTATGTTIAAFVPMLLSQGATGEFTRAIPILIIVTLLISYLYAIVVTPVLSQWVLVPRRLLGRVSALERVSAALGRFSVRRYRLVLALAALLVGASFGATGWVESRFFPSSDRNQVLVELRMPEGTHLDRVDALSRTLEEAVRARPEVTQTVAFVGRSAPHFYYNLTTVTRAPQYAQLVIETRHKRDNDPLITWIRSFAARQLPEVEVIARGLEQGPGLPAPIELRLLGEDRAALRDAADRLMRELAEIEGAVDIRNDGGLGVPTLELDVDDASAIRHGLTRLDIARALAGHTHGLDVGQYRGAGDPVPILVRSATGEDTPVSGLPVLSLGAGAQRIPLDQVARLEADWRAAAISHFNGRRRVSVLAELEPGHTSSAVLADLLARLEADPLRGDVTLQIGGESEGSSEANGALLQTLPLGVLMLLGFLMVEFNSFRRVLIVLTTVPLAAAGVVPGLIFGQQPFGFMSLLGVIALLGIVVNNAIVLLDVVERRRAEGGDIDTALVEAVQTRIRPILLTTVTTVAGLWPLATSDTALWPPLAWAMISGLIASTALTLLVVPAVYKVLFRR